MLAGRRRVSKAGARCAPSNPELIQGLCTQVLLCSLDGDVFPKPAARGGAEPARDAHLARLLPAVLAWAWPPDQALRRAADGDEGELLDACR